MITDFTQLSLHPQLVQAVTEQGYTNPTPIQAGVIPLMLAGHDVIGQAQTGTGKTAAFALPMIHNLEPHQKLPQGLVLAPTRELALQVAGAMTEYGRHSGARILAVYGGQAYGPQIDRLQRGVDIIVGTPGRLIDLIERKVLNLSQVHTLVLDEADEMLSMGFVEDIETILSNTPLTRQTALFSATMPAEIRRLAEQYMNNPQSVSIQRDQVTVDTIEQRYYMVRENNKVAALTRLFEVEEISSALIFVRTRIETGDLAGELTARGYPAEALSGELSQDARERTLNRFRQNQIKVVVATDVAARGLDIDDISHVFNYSLPDDPEIYVHRIGRTGRAGKTGIAITLVSPSERRRLGQVEHFLHKKIQQASIPTEEDIRAHREQLLANKVMVWLKRGRCLNERAMAERLIAEGFDALDIAAAALKVARAEEKQRPIYPIQAVQETQPEQKSARKGSDPFRRSANLAAFEPGMLRLQLNIGRQQGIKPGEIVGVIAKRADIPGSAIGKIRIQDNHTFVDVPEEMVQHVIARTRDVSIRKMRMDLQLA
ncbi:MAG TPA: DEAD/DEAH box helicase [Anaerolineaceae bacterium]|nr:DEAD/DEAH box helicase [Anaerolineaceae bacterium]HQN04588.1 DEAD/DEAH box helicase [Anaerolineaceae bacterium]